MLDLIVNLANLKARIMQHIQNVTPKTRRFVGEHAVYRFELVAENGAQHTEYVLRKSSDN